MTSKVTVIDNDGLFGDDSCFRRRISSRCICDVRMVMAAVVIPHNHLLVSKLRVSLDEIQSGRSF